MTAPQSFATAPADPDVASGTNGPGPRRRAIALYGATAAAALAAPRLARLLGRRLPRPVADSVTIAGLVTAGWATIAATERRHPFRPEWNVARGDVGTDLADLAISDGWARVAAGIATRPITNRIRRKRVRRGRGRGPLSGLPLVLQVGIVVVVYDLGHYIMHRVMHERIGWSVHAAHHSPERLYWLNATRFHPLELAIDGAQEKLALELLGPSREANIAYQVFRGIFGQIQHANVDIDSGPLNAVLSTPERHRWHHSVEPSEGNTNYGAIVSVWDRALGSSFTPKREFDADLGNGDPDYPQGWAAQLLAPLR